MLELSKVPILGPEERKEGSHPQAKNQTTPAQSPFLPFFLATSTMTDTLMVVTSSQQNKVPVYQAESLQSIGHFLESSNAPRGELAFLSPAEALPRPVCPFLPSYPLA